jgi:PAS domain S-box-containing protein
MSILPRIRAEILVALACLALLGLQGWIEARARATQIQATDSSLASLAHSLNLQAEDTIGVADTVLTMLVEQVETEGAGPEAIARLNRKLAAQIAEGPRYRSVTVVDAHGDSIASSFPDNHTNVSAREYFLHHRDDPSRGPYISHPIRSRETGHWILTVTRRIQAADGSFAGVAFVSIELNDFASQYATYDLGRDSAIVLAMGDGTVLARHPGNEQAIGRTLAKGAFFSTRHAKSIGSYEGTSIIDGVNRLVGYARNDKFSFIVLAQVSKDRALAAWRAQAWLHMAITLVLSLAVGLLGLYLARQGRRSQAAEQALRKNQAFLDRTGRIAGIGGWEIDLPSNAISWSDETRRIYGLQPGHVPTLKEAIDFFAPEARPVMAAAFERCVVHGVGWDMELPFVRADGAAVWVRSVGSCIRERGKAVRVSGAIQNVTARVTERLALEAANERVTLATDSGRIGIWDWDIANDTMVWDSWMYRLYGAERPAGRQTYELWRQQLHPDDRAGAEQAVRDAMDGLKPYLTEFRVVWPDGSVHHMRGSGRVIRNAAGAAIRMFGANWDVTDLSEQNILLARAEQQAAAAGAQYRLLADNAADARVWTGGAVRDAMGQAFASRGRRSCGRRLSRPAGQTEPRPRGDYLSFDSP